MNKYRITLDGIKMQGDFFNLYGEKTNYINFDYKLLIKKLDDDGKQFFKTVAKLIEEQEKGDA